MFTESGKITLLSGEALATRRRVKLSGVTLVYADAGQDAIGVTEFAVAITTNVTIRTVNDSGTFEMTASGAITAGVAVYAAADGKISATPSGPIIGYALEAATADNDQIEVLLFAVPVHAIKKATVTLTSAQILLLATTQIELIPAPGADKVIQVLSIEMILDYGSNVFTEPSAPDDLEVVYDTAGGTSIADVIGDFIINSADTFAHPQIKDVAGAAATTMVNKAVVIDNNGADYGGNAGDDSELTVHCTYAIHDCGLA